MGYEKLGYLIIGVVFLGGITFFVLGGRLGMDWQKKLGFLLSLLAVAAAISWALRVDQVRTTVRSAKYNIVIPGPGEPIPAGFGEKPQDTVRYLRQQLQKAKDSCRAYGWKWEKL